MFNLINQITQEDRVKIENYIRLYGAADHFIGLDEWLKNWAASKVKLYKLLGNNLIYKIPYEYERSEAELRKDLDLLIEKSKLPDAIWKWIDICVSRHFFDYDISNAISDIWWAKTLCNNKISRKIKFKLPDAKKELQLQAGTKPVRALSQLIAYIKQNPIDGYSTEEVSALEGFYKDFQTAHSILFNDKIVKGNIVLSIHPLDYMTMSDNASNWQSCMNWHNQGCYRTGTVEMMNSNNVLCCYLEGSTPFNFSHNDKENDPNYIWNNKKWRQLVYVTKDIIVTGKPYPYSNTELSKALLSNVQSLAKKNLNWYYSFGIEQYQDMKYINSTYAMDRARDYRQYNPRKHNILFDTKGMYNDMLNDSNTKYWCVRNKVQKTKIISYSGKAPCLCCGKSVLYFDDSAENYNDRYGNTDAVVCSNCERKWFVCNCCGNTNTTSHMITFYETEEDKKMGRSKRICTSCWKQRAGRCPVCGEIFDMGQSKYVFMSKNTNSDFNISDLAIDSYFDWYHDPAHFEETFKDKSIVPVCMHKDCIKKLCADEKIIHGIYTWETQRWMGNKSITYTILPYKENYEDMLKSKINKVEPQDDLVLGYFPDYWD